MSEKKQNEIKDEKIEGQIDIAEQEIEPKVEEPKMSDTIALAVENGLVAIDPTLEADVTELETPGEITLQPMVDETCTCETEDRCADHIGRTKILDAIDSTMAKYQGKVVLAMSEVRDIIKAITTAINE